eukprot:GHVN01037672.1.p1 GENE.GHVN01037672.1~~GHVN01037672.1.p1  ORF type:complete len:819 (+),score=148.54 GHVN01037672.1:43-2499(+)
MGHKNESSIDLVSGPSGVSIHSHTSSAISTFLKASSITRVVTFAVNLSVARWVSSKAYLGVGVLQFPLLQTLITFVAKEGIRRVALRGERGTSSLSSPSSQKRQGLTNPAQASTLQSAINLSWVSAAFIIPVCVFAVVGFSLFNAPFTLSHDSHYGGLSEANCYAAGVLLVGIAGVIEGLGEVGFIYLAFNWNFGERSFCEAVGLVMKALTMVTGLGVINILAPTGEGAEDQTGGAGGSERYVLVLFGLSHVTYAMGWLAVIVKAVGEVISEKAVGDVSKENVRGDFHTHMTLLGKLKLGISNWPLPKRLVRANHTNNAQSGALFSLNPSAWRPSFLSSTLATWMTDSHLSVLSPFLRLSLLKIILSEGERLMMMFFLAPHSSKSRGYVESVPPKHSESPHSLGVAAVIGNLANAVSRSFFAPIEELATAVFSQFAQGREREKDVVEVTADHVSEVCKRKLSVKKRGVIQMANVELAESRVVSEVSSVTEMNERGNELGYSTFRSVSTLEVCVGLACTAFGPPVCGAALYLLYGVKWCGDTLAVGLLQWYCFQLLLMSLNGILEAWMYSTASSKWLDKCQTFSLITSLVSISVSSVLIFVGGEYGGASLSKVTSTEFTLSLTRYLPTPPVCMLVGSSVGMVMRCSMCLYYVHCDLQRCLIPPPDVLGGKVHLGAPSSSSGHFHTDRFTHLTHLTRIWYALVSPELQRVMIVGMVCGTILRFVLSPLGKELLLANSRFGHVVTTSTASLCMQALARHAHLQNGTSSSSPQLVDRSGLVAASVFDIFFGIAMGLVASALLFKGVVRVVSGLKQHPTKKER